MPAAKTFQNRNKVLGKTHNSIYNCNMSDQVNDIVIPILKNLQKDIAEIKEDISGVKKNVTGVKEDVAGLKKRVGRLETQMENLLQASAYIQTDVHWLKDTAERSDLRLQVVEGHMEGFVSTTKYHEYEMKMLQGRINAMEEVRT